MHSLRSMDSSIEREIAKYLDEYFYKKYVKDFLRYNDLETQMKGIDVSFSFRELTNIIVDEKAAAHYINKNIPTFAFEIDFYTSDNELVEGWFYDENKLTQFYLLMWVNATKDKYITKGDITRLDCLLIERRKIHEYLHKFNLDKNELRKISNEARAKKHDGVFGKVIGKKYYFCLTQKLQERPFNIIIRREILDQLAHTKFIVTPNRVIKG